MKLGKEPIKVGNFLVCFCSLCGQMWNTTLKEKEQTICPACRQLKMEFEGEADAKR
jgi:hypothetical protein